MQHLNTKWVLTLQKIVFHVSSYRNNLIILANPWLVANPRSVKARKVLSCGPILLICNTDLIIIIFISVWLRKKPFYLSISCLNLFLEQTSTKQLLNERTWPLDWIQSNLSNNSLNIASHKPQERLQMQWFTYI